MKKNPLKKTNQKKKQQQQQQQKGNSYPRAGVRYPLWIS